MTGKIEFGGPVIATIAGILIHAILPEKAMNPVGRLANAKDSARHKQAKTGEEE